MKHRKQEISEAKEKYIFTSVKISYFLSFYLINVINRDKLPAL